MTNEQLNTIRHFSREEIEASGGQVAALSYDLFQKLDLVHDIVDSVLGRPTPMRIPANGLNSGHHISNTDVHAQGLAGDWYYDTDVDPSVVFWAMVDAGLKGIGLYWNGTARSYHGDVRETLQTARWVGLMKPGATDWTYVGFGIVDPKNMTV